MSSYNKDYILYRREKSQEALSDAIILANSESWNACVNRLYYASYYAISALLLVSEIDSRTHAGVRTQFNQEFIKTGIISKEFGQLYAYLFDSRQKGDYGDMFDFDKDTVAQLIEPVRNLIAIVMKNIDEQA